ncbi:hypothetical protein GJ744_003527 [Endocarpon pusillum]|uniref:Uncharacterized protein n=1 Tax=Endocarpon pusillum TaxID=364733 RepID=A0A8H7E9K1_9EURO|nr:hypothetical protein GJ744_003527 [Endocarpon pusillum]
MSDATHHVTSEESRGKESPESRAHGGNTPAGSEPSTTNSTSEKVEPKNEKIERVKENLPLPEDPPAASDWNSADSRTVNVGSGAVEDDVSKIASGSESGLREPATAESSVRVDGEELHKPTVP